MLQSDITSDQW